MHEWNAEESFREDLRNLYSVILLPVSSRQRALDCPAQSSCPVATHDASLYCTGEVKEVPIRVFDFSREGGAIEILDDPPPLEEYFTLDR